MKKSGQRTPVREELDQPTRVDEQPNDGEDAPGPQHSDPAVPQCHWLVTPASSIKKTGQELIRTPLFLSAPRALIFVVLAGMTE